jgi:hypothetical protein
MLSCGSKSDFVKQADSSGKSNVIVYCFFSTAGRGSRCLTTDIAQQSIYILTSTFFIELVATAGAPALLTQLAAAGCCIARKLRQEQGYQPIRSVFHTNIVVNAT